MKKILILALCFASTMFAARGTLEALRDCVNYKIIEASDYNPAQSSTWQNALTKAFNNLKSKTNETEVLACEEIDTYKGSKTTTSTNVKYLRELLQKQYAAETVNTQNPNGKTLASLKTPNVKSKWKSRRA